MCLLFLVLFLSCLNRIRVWSLYGFGFRYGKCFGFLSFPIQNPVDVKSLIFVDDIHRYDYDLCYTCCINSRWLCDEIIKVMGVMNQNLFREFFSHIKKCVPDYVNKCLIKTLCSLSLCIFVFVKWLQGVVII